ncbi:DivIVA domain-containing protein [Mycoplasmopsis caviae]|uniref:DivIVA domain-containing protein n=1 Tax=Mycoplasmopsis caviae TaxID=55603 RepID=A0A3P8KMM2_9BACT|nr:DivIVA domain-containing protein [Mycoplasmopsis caviae]UUD35125.1 DivIVA domain-containing protein [Mycoplasmopsis caviae]VDR42058.1 Uncharacterised protein [Mycoplasmopsis caviae]
MKKIESEKFFNKNFTRELNGYSVPEVDSFIDQLWNYIKDLESEIESLEEARNSERQRLNNKIIELENKQFNDLIDTNLRKKIKSNE